VFILIHQQIPLPVPCVNFTQITHATFFVLVEG
jgi:hypothetical protein